MVNNLLAKLTIAMIATTVAGATVAPSRADMATGDAAYERRDYEAAFQAWLPEAEAGNPVAQNNIGFMYRKGRGVAPSEAEAVKWYRKAADQGFGEAMTNLGFMFDEGRGVERDHIEAYKWFLLAAERDREGAEGHLAFLRDEGYVTPEDIAQAERRAADWHENHGQ